MTVRDILARVAKIAEGDSLCASINRLEDATDEKVKNKVDTLLDCYNSVIRGIALNYYEYVETVEVPVKTVTIANLSPSLLKIISIRDKQGNNLQYKTEGGDIIVEKYPFVFSYRAFPRLQALNEVYLFDRTVIGENTVIYGTLAEYMLVENRIDEAQNWDSKFRQSMDFRLDFKARKMKAGKKWGL